MSDRDKQISLFDGFDAVGEQSKADEKTCSGLAGIVFEGRWGQTLVCTPCLWPLSKHGQGPIDETSCHMWLGGNKLCASPHRCTVMTLPCLPSETRVQPLKHVAGRPCYTTQGKGMHPLGCHIRRSVLPQLRQLLPGGSVALWSDVVYVCTSKSRGE